MEDEALIYYKSEGVERSIECENGCSDESFADLIKEKGGESSSNSEILLSEMTELDDQNFDLNHLIKEKGGEKSSSSEVMTELDGQSQGSAEDSSSSTSMMWQVQEMPTSNSPSPRGREDAEKKGMCNENFEEKISGLPMSGIQIQCAYVHNLCLSFWLTIFGEGKNTRYRLKFISFK